LQQIWQLLQQAVAQPNIPEIDAVADIRDAAHCRLHSVDSPTMLVPSSRLSDRAFSVAAARAWNSLPPQTRADF